MTVQTNDAGAQAAPIGTPGTGQEPNPQQGQQGAPTGQESQQPPTGEPQKFDPETIEDPAIRAVVTKIVKDAEEARKEAAKHRTEAKTYQEQLLERQRADETAEQTAARLQQESQDRLAALEQENRDLKIGSVVSAAAAKAGAFNPSTVQALIDKSIETDDKGNPTNVDALLVALKTSDPYLFKRENAGADAGAGGGAGTGAPVTGVNDFIRTNRAGQAR